MTWLTLNEAILSIERKRKEGAHIFFYPYRNSFRILRDSRNGQYAGDYIDRDGKYYQGYVRDIPVTTLSGREPKSWTRSSITIELLGILEVEIHNFPKLTQVIIDANSNASL